MNRIRVFALKFESLLLLFIIVNVNIVILDIHVNIHVQQHRFISMSLEYIRTHKVYKTR